MNIDIRARLELEYEPHDGRQPRIRVVSAHAREMHIPNAAREMHSPNAAQEMHITNAVAARGHVTRAAFGIFIWRVPAQRARTG